MPAKGTGTVNRARTGIICQCGCGTPIPELPHHKYRGTPDFLLGHRSRTPEARAMQAERSRGNKNRRRERILRNGYWHIYKPDHPHSYKQGYVPEHRLIVEAAIGRFLQPQEIVHHLNGDSLDNRVENLQLLPHQGQHLLKHPGNIYHRLKFEGLRYNRHSRQWEPLRTTTP